MFYSLSLDLSPIAPELQSELGVLRDELSKAESPDYARIAAWRLLASNTLVERQSELRKGWDLTNSEIAALLQRGERLSVAAATRLHTALGVGPSDIRSDRIYTADEEYLSPERVLESLDALDAALADENVPPLFRAFRAYVGIVTIHPFLNGNGRTARLLADAFLLGDNYLPL